MRMTESYILLRKVRFHAFHGVMPQERTVGADFLLSLRIAVDLSRPVATDAVDDTLNYAAVYAVAKREMLVPSDLLEHVAGRIAEALFREFPQIMAVDLRLMKENPPMGADCEGAGVELHLINDKTQ